MTKYPMTKECRSTNAEAGHSEDRHSRFVIRTSFVLGYLVIRHYYTVIRHYYTD